MVTNSVFYAVWLPDVGKYAACDADYYAMLAEPAEAEHAEIMDNPKAAAALAEKMNGSGYATEIVEVDVGRENVIVELRAIAQQKSRTTIID